MSLLNIIIPASEKVAEKVFTTKNAEKELLALLELWADETAKPEKKEEYFNCARHNQKLTPSACLNRQLKKKRGCSSCKTGKVIKKIEILVKELKSLQ